MYDDINATQYQLHAILVHDGVAAFGDYWVFVYDSKVKKWYKFNDQYVVQVTEEEVQNASFGGTTSSAYCIVYISGESLAQESLNQDWISFVHPSLKQEWEQANVKLKHDIVAWEEEHIKKRQEQMLKFTTMYTKRKENVKYAQLGKRIKQYYSYCLQLDERLTRYEDQFLFYIILVMRCFCTAWISRHHSVLS